MISFNEIPANLRVPLTYLEFDPSAAGGGTGSRRLLVIGQRLAAGTVAKEILKRVNNKDEAEDFFGRGSQLAEMFRWLKKANEYVETYAIAVDDDAGGVAAGGVLAFTGPATAAGTLVLYIGGHRITVAVAVNDAATAIATAVAAAINLDTTCSVTAAVDGVDLYKVNLTCRWKGETGNDIPLMVNYYQGEVLPAGVGVTITPMAAGATNPDIANAIAALGEERFQTIVCPFVDASNLTELETELASRWGPLRQNDGYAFVGYRGTLSATGTFGNTRNSHLVSCIPTTDGATEPPFVFAAVAAVMAEYHLAIDPARPLQTIVLPNLRPPIVEKRWTVEERNTLLTDGVSTFMVTPGGQVAFERVITMYQLNAYGQADTAYLNANTPYTLSYLREALNSRISSKYPRHKLADDGTQFGPGQAIVTPKVIKAEILSLFRDWEQAGLVENFDQFKADLLVERNAGDKDRLDVLLPPDLINGFRVFAAKLQWRQ